jgi:hypothetical protein
MGRPRKPTELLELTGAFDKNPSRRRPVWPKTRKSIGEPPDHLSDEEQLIWAEVMENAPTGVLTSADRFLLARFVQLESKARSKTLTDVQSNQHLRILTLMGWTPADRSRIQSVGSEPPEDDPWAKFRT